MTSWRTQVLWALVQRRGRRCIPACTSLLHDSQRKGKEIHYMFLSKNTSEMYPLSIGIKICDINFSSFLFIHPCIHAYMVVEDGLIIMKMTQHTFSQFWHPWIALALDLTCSFRYSYSFWHQCHAYFVLPRHLCPFIVIIMALLHVKASFEHTFINEAIQ